MERFIVGPSEKVEAEYALRAESPFTILFLDEDGAPISVEGFRNITNALQDLMANEVPVTQIEVLG